MFLLPSQKTTSKEIVKYLDPVLWSPAYDIESDIKTRNFFSEDDEPDPRARNYFSKDDEPKLETKNFFSKDDEPELEMKDFFSKGDEPELETKNFFSKDDEPELDMKDFFSKDDETELETKKFFSKDDEPELETKKFFSKHTHDFKTKHHFGRDEPMFKNKIFSSKDEPELETISKDDEPELEIKDFFSKDDEPELETKKFFSKDEEPELETKKFFSKHTHDFKTKHYFGRDEPKLKKKIFPSKDEPELETKNFFSRDDEPELEDKDVFIKDDEPELETKKFFSKDEEPELETKKFFSKYKPDIKTKHHFSRDEPMFKNKIFSSKDEPELETISKDDEPELEIKDFFSKDDEPELETKKFFSKDEEPELETKKFFSKYKPDIKTKHYFDRDEPIFKNKIFSSKDEPELETKTFFSKHDPYINKYFLSKHYSDNGQDENKDDGVKLKYMKHLKRKGKRNLKPNLHSGSMNRDHILSNYDNDVNYNGKLGDWPKESFCYKFLVETFKKAIPVCRVRTSMKSAECFGNSYDDNMGTCILRNVAVNPQILMSLMSKANKTPRTRRTETAITLLDDMHTTCERISSYVLEKHMSSTDYIYLTIKVLKQNNPMNSEGCEKWINKDVYLFSSNEGHIYFRFLDYFNVHKILEDFSASLSENIYIIRVSESGYSKYKFPEFDKKMFPEAHVQTLNDLGSESVCFKKITLVPRSYYSVPFRCKMSLSLELKCSECDGKSWSNTQFSTFRTRVLKACSINDMVSGSQQRGQKVTVISRKAYKRYPEDSPNKFKRILTNEEEMVSTLEQEFSTAVVQVVHFEDLSICEQVRLAHSSDVLIGVHGAGLVHLWWLRDDALVYEIEPDVEMSNPTFHTLATLTGRTYMKQTVPAKTLKTFVKVDVEKVMRDLSTFFSDRL